MTTEHPRRTVLIIITLDTKSDEARFLKEGILEDGVEVIVLDSGILGEPRGGLFQTSRPPKPPGPLGRPWKSSGRKVPVGQRSRKCSRA